MKRVVSLISIFIIMSQFLVGCSSNSNVKFKEVYSEVIGFSKTDEKLKPVPQNAILMINNDEFQKFKDKYFTKRKLSIGSPAKDKEVLYLQFSATGSSIPMYKVKSIKRNKDTLIVNVKQTKIAEVSVSKGFGGNFKWVMIVELDKTKCKAVVLKGVTLNNGSQ